jgi:hypothetical protein
VFDADAAPRSRVEFRNWFDEQSKWSEPHGYNDPEVPGSALRNWFFEMIITFPPMNGLLRSSNADDPRVSDYSLGRHMIYGAFAGSVGAAAHQRALELAKKHRVGFYSLSDEPSEIWIPESAEDIVKLT